MLDPLRKAWHGEKQRHPIVIVRDEPVGLVLANHLNDALDSGDRGDHVVHDRGVAVVEALVGHTQVGMRVDVEDAHARMALGAGLDRAKGAAVVPPDDADDLARVDHLTGLVSIGDNRHRRRLEG